MSELKFIKTETTDEPSKKLADLVGAQLKNDKKVLLLLSGGSSVELARETLEKFDTPDILIAQVDERYGPLGHKDSNWNQIKNRTIVSEDSRTFPILQGEEFEETADEYDRTLRSLLEESDYRIAVLGIGADGHTAGILPNSPALASEKLVAAYKGPDFLRITITPIALKELDAAVVYAAGGNKKHALSALKQNTDPTTQPAQLLKAIDEVYIFNDQTGGEE